MIFSLKYLLYELETAGDFILQSSYFLLHISHFFFTFYRLYFRVQYNRINDFGARKYINTMNKSGANIFTYLLHHKMILLNIMVSIIGSKNIQM